MPMTPDIRSAWDAAQRFGARQDWSKAAVGYRRILDGQPGFVPAWLELSSALEKLDRYRESHECALNAARAGGPNVEPMTGLAIARRLRRFEEGAALQAYVAGTGLATRLGPDRLVELVMLLTSIGAYDRTEEWLERARSQQRSLPQVHHMLGVVAMFRGDRGKAAAEFREAIRLHPGYSAAYSILSRVDGGATSTEVDALRALLARPDAQPRDEIHYAYALHNALHSLGDHAGAWSALARACAAKRTLQPYDHASTTALFDAQKRAFDAYAGRPGFDMEGVARPVFIVGMHRSGTTLLERILAGHPDVADAGETYTFTSQLRWSADHFCAGVADLELARRSTGLDFRELGERFSRAMAWRTRGCRIVTEKLNPNFVLLGQIATALPAAGLVHIRRDAVDTCFSNLRTLFTIEAAYSYDMVELADFYKAYVDLMAFWSDRLGDRIHHVAYDRLTQEPEASARALARYCDIPFREDMLDVSRPGGMVATASTNDVRSGILRNRGQAWKPYERELAPLVDRLAHHGLA